jgi:hypothetical protein
VNRLAAFLGMPWASRFAIAVVSIALIRLLPGTGILVALVVLCVYPIVDVPRILARPSWWRGAIVSAFVWFILFVTLVGTVDSVRPLRDDAMVFLFPFMLYPMALAISGLVRLEGRLRGRPRESGPRIAAILVTVACGLSVVVPVTLGVIPVLTEKITGNTPRNTVYSEDGDVVSAAPGRVSVRLAGKTESFRLGPETKFDFRGPGSPLATGTAGPAWLKAGQRVGLEYVYRGGEAQAERVNIWIDRKGCAGDAKWAAVSHAPASSTQAFASLAGTTWEGWVGARDESGRQNTTLEFLAENRLAYQDRAGARHTDGLWRQNGPAVIIEVNDCYAEYEGRIDGDEIKGQFSNEVGMRASWTARRQQTHAQK